MTEAENNVISKPSLRECTNFATWTIKKICREIGPRVAGSDEELKAQQFMAKQVGKAADEVKIEEFPVHTKAFFGWFKITGVLLPISTLLYIFGMYVATWVICAYVLSMIVFEFLMYKQYVDWMFKEYTSHNCTCSRKPTGEVKRRIIFAGHADSVFEWRPLYKGKAFLLFFTGVYAAVGLGYQTIFSIIRAISEHSVWNPSIPSVNANGILAICAVLFIPGYIMFFRWADFKNPVKGANDNLTGCMVGAAVLKYMDDNNIRFENTEVVAMFSGSEEPGLRGAKAWAKAHKKECDEIETMFVALDTFRDYEDMFVYNRDLTGMVKHDKRCSLLMQTAAHNAGKDLKFSSIYAGASDAAAITQAGIPACSLAAMNPGPPQYYHTRLDDENNLDPKTIEKGIEICIEAATIFDKKGLCENY